MRRMKRAAGLAALVILVALAAPQVAMAHGAEHQGATPAHSEPAASAPHAVRNASAVASPSCPADHGGFCTCGSDLACPVDPAVVIAGPAALTTVLLPAVAVPLDRAMPRAPPRPFSLRFSRAPPVLS